MGGRDACDVGGDGRHRGQFLVPAAVDRLAGQCERGHRRGDELLGALGFRTAGSGDARGFGDQRGVEQLPFRQEPLDPVAKFGGEEARVGGGQHRCEHPERVAGQLIRVDRPERGGYHGHRRGRVAQVVEADRIHAERGEQVGDVGEFGARCRRGSRRAVRRSLV